MGNTLRNHRPLESWRFIPTPVGNTEPGRLLHAGNRFIPTPVGNTLQRTAGQSVRPVHPHACGEHKFFAVGFDSPIGSSPRLWGTLLDIPDLIYYHRFIPTPVGNTSCSPPEHRARTVHPHACGEHLGTMKPCSSAIGSSPRLWGTLGTLPLPYLTPRFIPTPVGNTVRVGTAVTGTSVHPHACGEHHIYLPG